MTDIPNRRQQDLRLDEFLRVQTEALGKHVKDYHPFGREEVARMVQQQKTNTDAIGVLTGGMEQRSEDISVIRLAMEGVPEQDANGVVIGHIGGMRNDIAEFAYLANGGGGVSVRRGDKWQAFWIGISGTVIAALGFIIAAWISS